MFKMIGVYLIFPRYFFFVLLVSILEKTVRILI